MAQRSEEEKSETLLEIRRVNLAYGGSHILRDVNLSIPKGAVVSLMGRNGAGKTTLLRAVMGVLPLQSGYIAFAGNDFRGFRPDRRARLGLGYVPQGRQIFPQLTVEENLRIALPRERKKIPDRIFELFPALAKMLRRRGGDLSGGMQQQLAIGRALTLEPSLLILDEPTEGIQPNIVHEIAETVIRLNRETGLTVLLAEQKLAFARKIARQFSIMEKGRIVASGPIAELTNDLAQHHLAVQRK